jgi:hypothetical protein
MLNLFDPGQLLSMQAGLMQKHDACKIAVYRLLLLLALPLLLLPIMQELKLAQL